jgi:hypothetical protein
VHIGICAGGCNAGDGPKDKPDVALFLAEALTVGAHPASRQAKALCRPRPVDHRAGEIGEGLRLGPGPGDTIFHYLSKKHLSCYLHEIGFRWNQRKLVLKTNEKSELKLVMKRLPVMARLRSLLAHAPGRQLRRSINSGIYCPEPT